MGVVVSVASLPLAGIVWLATHSWYAAIPIAELLWSVPLAILCWPGRAPRRLARCGGCGSTRLQGPDD